MTELDYIARFLASLGIGLLLGLERERSQGGKAGVRTFALVAVLGTLCALLSEKTSDSLLLPVAVAALAAMMISTYRHAGPGEDPGTTTMVSLLICFGLGAATWFGYQQIAVVVALAVTGLLYFKAELHGMTQRLSRQDWVSLFQFAVVTFVVLPVLPDKGFGPLGALNPYRIWLMVVLISGLSFVGYLVLRLAGDRQGITVIGLVGALGGLVSSTATTLAYSRHARSDRAAINTGLVVVLTANAAVLVKLAVETAMVAPDVLPKLLPVLAGGLLVGLPLPLIIWHRLAHAAEIPHLEISNPSEMRVALGFGVLYAGVLLALAWLHHLAGAGGVYGMAILSGLTDIDAITLSTLQLTNSGDLSADQASRAIALAYLSSLGLKFVIVWSMAGWAFARRAGLGYLCVTAGLCAGFAANAA